MGKNNDTIRPCPECGADEVYIAEKGWRSNRFVCDNCNYEPEGSEVRKGLFESIRDGLRPKDREHEDRAVEIVECMDQEIPAEELITAPSPQLDSPISHINDGESLMYLFHGIDVDVDGDDAGHQNYTLVTDRRVFITTAGLLGKSTKHSISHHNITDISVGGRATAVLEIRTAGHVYEITGFDRDVAEACFEYVHDRVEAENSAKVADSDEENSALEKIERLAEMKEDGIISAEEFASKKQELLDEL